MGAVLSKPEVTIGSALTQTGSVQFVVFIKKKSLSLKKNRNFQKVSEYLKMVFGVF